MAKSVRTIYGCGKTLSTRKKTQGSILSTRRMTCLESFTTVMSSGVSWWMWHHGNWQVSKTCRIFNGILWKSLDGVREDFWLAEGITFENHPNSLSSNTNEVAQRLEAQQPEPSTPRYSAPFTSRSQADEICVHTTVERVVKSVLVVEYKAPHKFTPAHISAASCAPTIPTEAGRGHQPGLCAVAGGHGGPLRLPRRTPGGRRRHPDLLLHGLGQCIITWQNLTGMWKQGLRCGCFA